MKNFRFLPWLLPRLQDVVFIGVFYFVLLIGSALFRDGDPGRHITLGTYMLEHLSLPQVDLFSYTTPGVYLPPYEWGAQIILAAANRWLGLSGVVWVVALCLGWLAMLVFDELRRRQVAPLLSFGLTLWCIGLTMIHWAARPHIFSLVFLALLAASLARLAQGENISLWRFPLILWAWANIHGAGFMLAFLLWAAYLAGELWESWAQKRVWWNPVFQKLVFSGALAFAATFFTPSGWRLWQFSLSFIGNPYLLEIAGETNSVAFHEFKGLLVLLSLMLVTLILSRSKAKRPMAESLLLAGWLGVGLYGWRNVPLFAIIAIPLLGEHLKGKETKADKELAALEHLPKSLWPALSAVVFAVLLMSGLRLDAAHQGYAFNTGEFPVQAVNWLEKNPQPGKMFNYFPWGGYLIYRLWPQQQIFLDGQMIYVESLVRDYETALNGNEEWVAVFQKYHVDWLLVPDEAPIARVLKRESGWELLYADETAVIFRRKP